MMSSKLFPLLTFAILLVSLVGPSGSVTISLDTSQHRIAQESFELHGPQNRTFHNDYNSTVSYSIVWWIENSTPATFSFDIFKNGTLEHSGIFESVSVNLGGPFYVHIVPVTEMDLGTYNYTMTATNNVSIVSSTVLVYIIERVPTAIPWFTTVLIVPILMLGFVSSVLVIWGIQAARSRPKKGRSSF